MLAFSSKQCCALVEPHRAASMTVRWLETVNAVNWFQLLYQMIFITLCFVWTKSTETFTLSLYRSLLLQSWTPFKNEYPKEFYQLIDWCKTWLILQSWLKTFPASDALSFISAAKNQTLIHSNGLMTNNWIKLVPDWSACDSEITVAS